VGFSGPEEGRVIEVAHSLSEEISRKGSKIEVMGPAPGYPSKLQEHYRWQLMLKVPNFSRNKDKLAEALQVVYHQRAVRVIVDVGPINPW
jgi:primosomal protein N' (replication factor Y)